MSKVLVTKSKLDNLAASVSTKSGESLPLTIDEMKTAVDSITGGTVNLETVTKSYTPTESQQTETIEPSSGYDGIGEVDVTVGAISSTYVGSGVTRRSSSDLADSGATVTAPAGYYGSSASKTVASGTEGTPIATKGTVSNHSVSVTPSVTNSAGYISGGTHTGTAVSVSASELVSGTLSVTSSGTKDVTNYASASVPSGTEGTPTATKGTVSNHAVSVTPSVTNSAGYISGGTHSGSAVSVSASELVSGTYSVTSSGTKDVTNYASASIPAGTAGTPTATKGTVSNHSVSVTPSVTNQTGFITGSTKTGTAVTVSASELDSGAKSITANGNSQDVVGYASVNVNVPNSYSASDEGKVVSSGALVSQTSATYTSNDTYDTTLINSVTVNVSGGGTGAISVVDTTDTAGGTIREITAIDISDTTATASDVASGKYFYTAAGVKTAGTASGGGNLGGLSNMLDVNSQDYEFAYMLMAMKKGNTAGGTVTYTTAFPNTETKILETGLTTVHGFMFVQPDIDLATTESGQCNKVILVFITSSDTINAVGFSTTNAARIYGQAQGTVQQATPLNGAIRVSGGDIYYTGRYNKNASYQMLKVNQQYEWLAW